MTPSFQWLFAHPAHWLAFGGGAGLSAKAPGTVGTLAIWPIFALLQPWLPAGVWLVVLLFAFGVGVWACAKTGHDLGVADHGGMVWDEMVAFALVLLFLPPAYVAGQGVQSLDWQALTWQAYGFFLFRLFDITKPQPIRYFDRTLKGGFGVMWDDVVAAFYALLVLAASQHMVTLVALQMF